MEKIPEEILLNIKKFLYEKESNNLRIAYKYYSKIITKCTIPWPNLADWRSILTSEKHNYNNITIDIFPLFAKYIFYHIYFLRLPLNGVQNIVSLAWFPFKRFDRNIWCLFQFEQCSVSAMDSGHAC